MKSFSPVQGISGSSPGIAVVTLWLAAASCVGTRPVATPEPTEGSPVTAADALEQGFFAAAGASKEGAAAALANLKAAGDRATPKERPLVAELSAILTRLSTNPAAFSPEDRRTLLLLIERTANLYPEDFDRQLAAATVLDALELIGRGSGHASPAPDAPSDGNAVAIVRAQRLVERFPGRAKAHGHLASILATTGNDELTAMRSYARCLTIEPANSMCRLGLGAMAEDWRRARCTGFDRQRFALHAAWSPSSPAMRRAIAMKDIRIDGKKLMMDPRPAVTGADVSEASLLPSTEGSMGTVQVWLTPQGAVRYAEITRQLAEEEGHLVIMIDHKGTSAPRVMSAIESGVLNLEQRGFKLAKICKSLQRRALPPDIAQAVGKL